LTRIVGTLRLGFRSEALFLKCERALHGRRRRVGPELLGLVGCGSLLLPLRVLAFSKYFPLEVLKGDHHDGDVVQRLPVERILENALNCKSALLMH